MELKSVQKVIKTGNSLMVVIPTKIARILNISSKDYLVITWGDVLKIKEEVNENTIQDIKRKIKELKEELPEI